jgi:hypothetical protein
MGISFFAKHLKNFLPFEFTKPMQQWNVVWNGGLLYNEIEAQQLLQHG